MIGGFRSVLCVSVFQGSLLVIVIMIDSSEKRNCECTFISLTNLEFWKSIINNFGSLYSHDKIHAGKNPLLAGWGEGNIKLSVIYT